MIMHSTNILLHFYNIKQKPHEPKKEGVDERLLNSFMGYLFKISSICWIKLFFVSDLQLDTGNDLKNNSKSLL